MGTFVIWVVLAFTLGSQGHNASSFLNNVHSADNANIFSTMVGGAISNLANLLLVAAIDMAGRSSHQTWFYLLLMFVFYSLAILTVARANGQIG